MLGQALGSQPLYPKVAGAKKATAIVSLVCISAFAMGLAGCFVGATTEHSSGNGQPAPTHNDPSKAQSVNIDPAQGLTTKPGEGVGIFVEYGGNGNWKIWTSCDSIKSGATCGFDLYVAADNLGLQSLDKLEDSDFVDVTGNMAHVSFDTTSDTDGVTFTASPKTPLDLEVYLDGAPAQEFVYWVGDGLVNSGAPSNPVDFVPR